MGLTPLHLSARYNSADAVQSLIKHGASVNAQDCRGKAPIHFAARRGFSTVVKVCILKLGILSVFLQIYREIPPVTGSLETYMNLLISPHLHQSSPLTSQIHNSLFFIDPTN
jgi:ankyrin repeat protein